MNRRVLEVLRISLKLWAMGNRGENPIQTGRALGFKGRTPEEMLVDIDKKYPPKISREAA